MKIYFTLLALFVIINSCDKIRGCRPEKHTYTFQTGKRIDTTRSSRTDTVFQYYTYQITNGNNLVFEYHYEFEDCPDMADDEGSRTILFEVPGGVDHFTFTDSLQLKGAKAILSMSCECIPYMPVFFKKGTLEGKRISETGWQIMANLALPGNTTKTISFSKIFYLK